MGRKRRNRFRRTGERAVVVDLRAPLHLGRGLLVSAALRQVWVMKRTVENRGCYARRRRSPGGRAPRHGKVMPIGGAELTTLEYGAMVGCHQRLRIRRWSRRRGRRRCVEQHRVDVRVLGRPAHIRGRRHSDDIL